MTNKYLEKIAATYSVRMDDQTKAHLSQKEKDKYVEHLSKKPGTARTVIQGIVGAGIGNTVGRGVAKSKLGKNTLGLLVGTYGAHVGIEDAVSRAKYNALNKAVKKNGK